MRALSDAVVLAGVLATLLWRRPLDATAEPRDFVSRPLVLRTGELDARVSLETNLEKSRYNRPLSLAPDVWIGVTDRWTVGLAHSNPSLDRIDAGASLCVRHEPGLCDRTYRGGHLDVRWSWREGTRDGGLAIAPRARVLLRDVDPVKPAVAAGALVRWTRGRFRISTDPYLRLGLANRDRGNRAAVMVPVWLGIQPTCRWLVELHTGYDGDLAVWPDGWHIPVALVIRVAATASIDVSVEGGASSLLGPQNNIKQRAAMLTIGWRGRVL